MSVAGLRHYYHVYASGTWPQPVAEHVAALTVAGFEGDVTVGLVGDPADRSAASGVIGPQLEAAGIPVSWLGWDTGYEQLTLSALRAWAQDKHTRPDATVLYAHAKGSADNSEWNAIWRRSMTHHVVGRWRECRTLLAEGYDTVGCHWLTPKQHHEPPAHPLTSPMYGGNFWWATAGYLAGLPEPGTESRWDAESWVGLRNPHAFDMLPGWPSLELCRPYAGEGGAGSCGCPQCAALRTTGLSSGPRASA